MTYWPEEALAFFLAGVAVWIAVSALHARQRYLLAPADERKAAARTTFTISLLSALLSLAFALEAVSQATVRVRPDAADGVRALWPEDGLIFFIVAFALWVGLSGLYARQEYKLAPAEERQGKTSLANTILVGSFIAATLLLIAGTVSTFLPGI